MVPDQLQAVRARIAAAARRVGRPSESVRLICVTKSATSAQLQEALAAGVTDCGESRVQAAEARIRDLEPGTSVRWPRLADTEPGTSVRWHLIGHLQRNKARRALELFDVIHAVDSLELADALERHAAALGRAVPTLIEVNTSGELAKHGVAPEATEALVAAARRLPHLQVQGLMTMAPIVSQPEQARPYFRRLRELAAACRLPELSMGMSQDFEVAIEEGATMVRVGGAIFG